MNADWIAAACAAIAVIAAVALALAKTRVAAALAFAIVAAFAGLTTIAAGAFDAGLVLIAAGMLIALMTMAAAQSVGEIAALAHRPAWAPLAACVTGALVLLLAWPNVPSTPLLGQLTRVAAFSVPRGVDLFIALAAFAAVGAGVVALLGFGERGVFGVDKDGAP